MAAGKHQDDGQGPPVRGRTVPDTPKEGGRHVRRAVRMRAARRSVTLGGMQRGGGKAEIRVRRVYEAPGPDDGVRVLVDRLWPRGLSKEDARVDEWPKSLTPSAELRRWYHGPDGEYKEFCRRYEAELAGPAAAEALQRLRTLVAEGPLTLLTAAKEPDRSHTSVLQKLLQGLRAR